MALKAGRVGVAPDQVDEFGEIKSNVTSGYTKQEADAKFETQTHAASIYETKTDADTALAEKQSIRLSMPIELLSGSALTVEDALQGLNVEKFDRVEQRVLGAKNILPYPYKDSTKTTTVGVAFTVNSDGSITIDTGGSASTGTADFKLFGAWADISELLPDGEYIASIDNNDNDITLTAVYNNTTLATGADSLNVNAPDGISYLMVRVASGVILDNVTIKPMLRLASDPNDEYTLYAMTNRELTVKTQGIINAVAEAADFSSFKAAIANL